MSDDVKILATPLSFTEGPIALPDGSIVFVEIGTGRLSRWRPNGTVEVVAPTGGGPNGAAIGPHRACCVCNNGGFVWHTDPNGGRYPHGRAPDDAGGRIERIDLRTGRVERLYDRTDRGPLSGPNDIVFDAHGGFWFTDLGAMGEREIERGRTRRRDHPVAVGGPGRRFGPARPPPPALTTFFNRTRRHPMVKSIIAASVIALTLPTGAFAADPIKLGFLSVDSGPFMIVMSHFTEPAQLAVEVLNAEGGALGRKFELVMQSHAGTPATAIAAASKLVDQQGVTMFSGFFTSSMSAALAPRLAGMKALMFDADTTSDDSIGKNCTANLFHTAGTNRMVLNALRNVVRKSGIKTWNVIGSDYAMGHDFATQIEPLIKAEGGAVQTQVFATLGTSDFGSHISKLAANPADGLAVAVTGVDSVNFFKQQKQFGLLAKYKTVISSSNSVNDAVLDAMGDSSVGVVLANQWDKGMPGDGNAAFVKAYEARYKKSPTFMDADVFQAFQLMRDGIVKARSTDAAAVRAALSGMKTNTLFGPVEVRAADHQVVRPMALQEVVAAGDGKSAVALRSLVVASDATPPVNPDCKM